MSALEQDETSAIERVLLPFAEASESLERDLLEVERDGRGRLARHLARELIEQLDPTLEQRRRQLLRLRVPPQQRRRLLELGRLVGGVSCVGGGGGGLARGAGCGDAQLNGGALQTRRRCRIDERWVVGVGDDDEDPISAAEIWRERLEAFARDRLPRLLGSRRRSVGGGGGDEVVAWAKGERHLLDALPPLVRVQHEQRLLLAGLRH